MMEKGCERHTLHIMPADALQGNLNAQSSVSWKINLQVQTPESAAD